MCCGGFRRRYAKPTPRGSQVLDYSEHDWVYSTDFGTTTADLKDIVASLVSKVEGHKALAQLRDNKGQFVFRLEGAEHTNQYGSEPEGTEEEADQKAEERKPKLFYPVQLVREEESAFLLIDFRARADFAEIKAQPVDSRKSADLKVCWRINEDCSWEAEYASLSWAMKPYSDFDAEDFAKELLLSKVIEAIGYVEDKVDNTEDEEEEPTKKKVKLENDDDAEQSEREKIMIIVDDSEEEQKLKAEGVKEEQGMKKEEAEPTTRQEGSRRSGRLRNTVV